MKKYRSLLIFIIITGSIVILYLRISTKPIVVVEVAKGISASSTSFKMATYIDSIDRTKTQSSLQHSSSSRIENNNSSEAQEFNLNKLSNEQFKLLVEKYSHTLPKTIGKTQLRSGGDSNGDPDDLKKRAYEGDPDDLKKRAYEGDPGAQFLYAKRLSMSLIEVLLKENADTKGNADILAWLAKHEEARKFLIESAVATGNGSATAHLGAIYGLAPISDNVEALAWSMISKNMGYEGMINICATSVNPCTTDQFINAHMRAKNYLNLYSFDLENNY